MSNSLLCNDFFKCPHCESTWFTVHSKLPAARALAANNLKGIFLYPVNAETGKTEALLVCANGHGFRYKEETNTYEDETEEVFM